MIWFDHRFQSHYNDGPSSEGKSGILQLPGRQPQSLQFPHSVHPGISKHMSSRIINYFEWLCVIIRICNCLAVSAPPSERVFGLGFFLTFSVRLLSLRRLRHGCWRHAFETHVIGSLPVYNTDLVFSNNSDWLLSCMCVCMLLYVWLCVCMCDCVCMCNCVCICVCM